MNQNSTRIDKMMDIALLKKPEFPKTNQYEPTWVLEDQMEPNALWLLEWLKQDFNCA